jgi:hypothetical protein
MHRPCQPLPSAPSRAGGWWVHWVAVPRGPHPPRPNSRAGSWWCTAWLAGDLRPAHDDGDHGMAKLWNRSELSVCSYCDRWLAHDDMGAADGRRRSQAGLDGEPDNYDALVMRRGRHGPGTAPQSSRCLAQAGSRRRAPDPARCVARTFTLIRTEAAAEIPLRFDSLRLRILAWSMCTRPPPVCGG